VKKAGDKAGRGESLPPTEKKNELEEEKGGEKEKM